MPFLIEWSDMPGWSERRKTLVLLLGIALGGSNCTFLERGLSNVFKGPRINQSLLLVNDLAKQFNPPPFYMVLCRNK